MDLADGGSTSLLLLPPSCSSSLVEARACGDGDGGDGGGGDDVDEVENGREDETKDLRR